MKTNNVMKWLWQLPQNIIGWCLSRFGRYEGDGVYRVAWPIGVCLGEYIIVRNEAPEMTVKHEKGHREQSRLLGPLYLIAVGVPSIVLNILARMWILDPYRYYERWPENWADKLGGVKRR